MFHLSRATALIAALSLLCLTALSVAASSRSSQDYPPRPGATPIFIIAPTTPPVRAVPTAAPPAQIVPPATSPQRAPAAPARKTLSPAQRVRAMRIVYLDPYVHRLLNRLAFRIAAVKPWKSGHGMRGAAVDVALAHAARVGGTWLRTPHRPYHAIFRHVTGLTVDIALKRGLVEAIQPRR